jgi:hypothetical protein
MSYVVMTAEKVRELAQATIDRIEAHNQGRLKKAISQFHKRRAWLISWNLVKPIIDQEVERRLRHDFDFFDIGGGSLAVAERLIKATKYSIPDTSIYVSVADLDYIT